MDPHIGLIRTVAYRYKPRAERLGLGLEDLLQEGRLAVHVCLGLHDPDRGAFSTFAVKAIRRRIARYLARYRRGGIKFAPREFRESLQTVSLQSPVGEGSELLDTIPDDVLTPEELVSARRAVSSNGALWSEAIACISEQERRIVNARLEGRTFRDIAKDVGFCHQRVAQVERDALERLRKKLRGYELNSEVLT